jgi:hypothetical protein
MLNFTRLTVLRSRDFEPSAPTSAMDRILMDPLPPPEDLSVAVTATSNSTPIDRLCRRSIRD